MGNLKNNTASLEALIEQANALPIAKTIQETKTATPTKSVQEVRPDSGYNGLESVTIEAIPDAYQDVTGVTSTAATTLTGSKFVDKNGTLTVGTMPNNGSVSQTIDGLETQSVSIPEGYTTGGTISLDSTIDNTASAQATTISEIAALLEGKSVSGGSNEDVTAETEAYTDLLTDLEAAVDALPDAGSGGGVETCTVVFAGSYYPTAIAYMALDDSGKPTARYMTNSATGLTLADVVCNSVMTAWPNYQFAAPQSTDAIVLGVNSLGYVLSIEAQSGGVATINFIASGSGLD